MNFYLKTDRGKMRPQNEDAICASDQPVGGLPNLFVLADGMGGYKAGDYASRRAIELLIEDLEKKAASEPIVAIQSAISSANHHIYEEASLDEEKKGMGTTLVAATVEDGLLTVANVGDSRLYLLQDETLRQVTHDHSYVEEMKRQGRMNEQDALYHPKKHYITRAIGAESEIRVDFFEEEVYVGDRVLLCSDGLTNMVSDEKIREILLTENVEQAAEELVRLANESGGRDNISVILVEI